MVSTHYPMIETLSTLPAHGQELTARVSKKRLRKLLTEQHSLFLSHKRLEKHLAALERDGMVTITRADLRPRAGAPWTADLLFTLTPKAMQHLEACKLEEQKQEQTLHSQATGQEAPAPAQRRELSRIAKQHALDQVEQAIIFYLTGLCSRFKKLYCYPSQKTILRVLREWFKITIARSTLNLRLDRLEALGFFRRIPRHRRGKDGKPELHSTLYELTGKVRAWLTRLLQRATAFFGVFGVRKIGQYTFHEGRLSREGPTDRPPPLDRNDPKGAPDGGLFSHSPPSHHFPEAAKAELRKLGLL